MDSAQAAQRTEQALDTFGLTAYAEVPPAVLGYGLRRKVAVAAVCAMQPDILILDEPTTGLDWRGALELMRLVADMHAQGHTILLITHDMRLVAEHVPEVVIMHEGRVLAAGLTEEVFANDEALATAQLEPPQVAQLGRAVFTGDRADLLTVPAFCQAYTGSRSSEP
jgi:energy-coupling factor transport system ATP-binding protein